MPRFPGILVEDNSDQSPSKTGGRFGGIDVTDQFSSLDTSIESTQVQPTQEEIAELPEFFSQSGGLSQIPFGEDVGARLRAGLGSLITISPKAQLDLIRSNFPNRFNITPLEEDNALITDKETGKQFQLNRRGLSGQDIIPFLGTAAASLPAGRFVSGAGSLLGTAARSALASGATETALQGLEAAAGSQQGFDPARTTLATVAGPVGDVLGQVIGSSIAKRFITPEQRQRAGQELAQRLNLSPEELTPEKLNRLGQLASESENIQVAERRALSEEFLPERGQLSFGEISGDPAQLSREQALQQGRGPIIATAREQARRKALEEGTQEAIERTERQISGLEDIQTSSEAGEKLSKGLKKIEADRQQEIEDAFTKFREGGELSFNKKIIEPEVFNETLRDADITDFTIEDLPKTSRALRILDSLHSKVGDDGKFPVKNFKSAMTQLFRLTKETKGEDRTGVRLLRGKLASNIDKSIEDGLFTGDPQVLNQLKEANKKYREFQTLFRDATGTTIDNNAGKTLQRILDEGADPAKTIDVILGKAFIGQPRESLALLKRIKQIIPKESDEFKSLRGAAFVKILRGLKTDPEEKVTKGALRRRLNSAFTGSGSNVVKELFNSKERETIKRLGKLVIATQPDLVNPSSTAQEIFSRLRSTLTVGGAGAVGAPFFGFNPAEAATGAVLLNEVKGLIDSQRARSFPKALRRGLTLTPLTIPVSEQISEE